MVSQGSFCISQLTLVHWSGQSGFLLFTQADSSSLEWSTRVTIVYHSRIWFTGVDSQGSYCIPISLADSTLVHWGDQPGLLLYFPADYGMLGWSSRACIPQPMLVHWGGQPELLLYIPADSSSLVWSARAPNVYLSKLWFLGVVSQGS